MRIIGDAELKAKLEALKSRIPSIVARTLTGLAFDARQDIQQKLPQWVTVRRPFLRNSVIYEGAKETELTAKVGFAERANFAKLLEEGGTRTPVQSSSIAVPTTDLKRTNAGTISSANRPSNVLGRKGVFLGIPEGHKKQIFGIWKKQKGTELKLLYVFKRKTTYRKKYLHFRETVRDIVQSKSRERFYSAFKKAVDDLK